MVHVTRLRRVGTIADRVRAVEKFDTLVDKQGPDDCWEWQGPRNNQDYGKVSRVYAHRYACERAHGPAPSPEHVVMHSCDNPPCVNPTHLSWATQSDNMFDMWHKGRRPRAKASR